MSEIKKIHQLLQSGEVSAVEIAKEYCQKAAADKLNAFITITEDLAVKNAEKIDEKLKKNEKIGILEGVPAALKDNIVTKGVKTTFGSKMLENYLPIYDAHIVERLYELSAAIVGKTNMDEGAVGVTGESSYFSGTVNPLCESCVAGGSSGGSSAAVKAGLCAYSIGSDSGGSVRVPAAFCGVVGLKPTYGAISRYGLIATASGFDTVGILANDVEDAAIVFDALATKDARDTTCVGAGGAIADKLDASVRGKKIGVIRQYFDGFDDFDGDFADIPRFEGVSGEVKAAVLRAVDVYKELGAEIVPLDLPVLKYAMPAYFILSAAEISSNFGRYDGLRYGYSVSEYNGVEERVCKSREGGFGKEIQRRIMLGTHFLSGENYEKYYQKAVECRGAVANALTGALESCDMLLTPTAPTVAPKFGADTGYYGDVCAVIANMAGLPAVSIPVAAEEMPVGAQLIGKAFCEREILSAGQELMRAFEDE